MGVLLEVINLTTEFHTQDGIVHAVNGVSFSVNEGETLGLVGESGCGKSVSVLSVIRLIPQPLGKIVQGQILFQGSDLLQANEEEMRSVRGNKIAMVFQDPMTSLNPVLTIGTQMGETLELHLGMTKRHARKRSIELLKMVGIPDAESHLGDYPHQFSGGMRQRVMIAMAVSCSPRLLIADEPTTALDVTIQAQILDIVKQLKRELGTAIIWITHDLGVIAGLADRINVMYAGFVIESAPVKRVFATPSHPYTLGLLGSIPRLDAANKSTLTPIEGVTPDLLLMPKGCPFNNRCRFRTDRCLLENPPLESISLHHLVACWNWQNVQNQRA
ncbi:MAG: ABC transporter ATP-binding protein [Anaerolineaceae bacterium]|nr:ABC transporter ATP-binding protein [Anaerolineaceae bacterium]